MPKEPELIARGRLDLKAAIRKFGGYPRVAVLLGIPYGSRKFWTRLDDLRPFLDPIVEEIGRMPGEPELKARGRQDLRGAIRKFGGYRVVAEALGYPYAGPREWSGVEDLRAHLNPIVAELGRMPTQPELLSRRRSDLARAIDKFGGFPAVAAALGYEYASLRSWRTVEALRPHLEPIVVEFGTMPTAPELRRRGRNDLIAAIGKFGGFPTVAATLGYEPASRPTFANVEDLRPQLDPIVALIGRMPGKHDLPTEDRHELLGAIRRFGGKTQVASALGYPHEKRHMWKDITDLRSHLDPLVTEAGRLPSYNELAACGASYLVDAIAKFGGPARVSDALGYAYLGPRSWERPEDLRPDLDEIVGQLGRMPTKRELFRQGRADVASAIRKFGGFASIATRFGYPYSPMQSWNNVEDLRPHLDPMVLELGRMPTSPELAARVRIDIARAIGKFGGFPEVAKLLGYGYASLKPWKSVQDLTEHLDPIVAELGRMPTIPELSARGRSDLINAIRKFGGMPKVAAAMGYPYDSPRSWSDVEDLRPYLNPIVAELGRMPKTPELAARGCSFLVDAIQKLGGFSTVAETLGFAYESRRLWTTVEDLRPHLDPIVDALGRMPKQPELNQSGRSWLSAGIEKFGGFPKVAAALGYAYESIKFWNSVDDFRPELGPIVDELGRMPSKPELAARGRSDLAAAIQKFGGQVRVAEVLGYPYGFATGIDRRKHLARLESALAQLHESHMLSAGQIMLILRHAGLLTRGHVAEVMQRLEAAPGALSEVITHLEAFAEWGARRMGQP